MAGCVGARPDVTRLRSAGKVVLALVVLAAVFVGVWVVASDLYVDWGDNIFRDVNGIEVEFQGDLEQTLYNDQGDDAPSPDAACVRPKKDHFQCSAYITEGEGREIWAIYEV